MKKSIVLLAVALMAIPAMAAVTVTGNSPAPLQGTITYSSTGTLVRAFALNITVDSGATITGVTVGNSKYRIYPGTISITTAGVVNSWGTPVAVVSQLPGDTLGGIGTSGVTIEMASLYATGDGNQPTASGNLVTITVDKACNVGLAANVSRGGVVLEDLTPVTPTYTPFAIPGTPTLCLGDIDGDTWISSYDYYALVGMLTPYAADDYAYPVDPGNPADVAADIDQDGWVSSYDYYALVSMLTPYAADDYAYPCP